MTEPMSAARLAEIKVRAKDRDAYLGPVGRELLREVERLRACLDHANEMVDELKYKTLGGSL